MAKYQPGQYMMQYEGADIEYVLDGFIQEVNQYQKCKPGSRTYREYYPEMTSFAARLKLSTETEEFWIKPETNTAPYLKKLVIGKVFKTTRERVATEDKKWWNKKYTSIKTEEGTEQISKYSPVQLERLKDRAKGKPCTFRDKSTHYQMEPGSCFWNHWETPRSAA
ncbi:hypothetical protein BDD12DRAFT_806082 [Trichophaea hybrida]|nr:hypothetical protein BDD12DRAFT_806082 [Trichophaea hybrida]